jgi:DNA-binding transcriptional LysR family regulator
VELRQLRHFVAVAEEGSIARAAQRSDVTTPTLSTSLLGLARELNADLFFRREEGLELTDAGWALLEPARAAVRGADRARSAVAEASGVLRGTVRIATVAVPPALDVTHAVQRIQDAHPEVDVQLIQDGARQVLDLVIDGRADFGITPRAGRTRPSLRVEPLTSAPLVLFCPPGHGLAEAREVDVAELVDEPVIDLPRGWWAREQFDRMFRGKNVYRRVRLEINDWLSVLRLVADGKGLAYGPSSVVDSAFFPDIEVATLTDAPLWELGITTRSGGTRGATVSALLAAYREQCLLGTRLESQRTAPSAHSMTLRNIG